MWLGKEVTVDSVKAPLLLLAGWTDYSHNNTQDGVPTDWEQTPGRPEWEGIWSIVASQFKNLDTGISTCQCTSLQPLVWNSNKISFTKISRWEHESFIPPLTSQVRWFRWFLWWPLRCSWHAFIVVGQEDTLVAYMCAAWEKQICQKESDTANIDELSPVVKQLNDAVHLCERSYFFDHNVNELYACHFVNHTCITFTLLRSVRLYITYNCLHSWVCVYPSNLPRSCVQYILHIMSLYWFLRHSSLKRRNINQCNDALRGWLWRFGSW